MLLQKKIYDANRNLLQRFKTEKVSSKYLKHEDVMLVVFGKPRVTDSLTIADGLFIIHYDPKDYKIYGFTVPYFGEFEKYANAVIKRVDHIKKQSKKENPKYFVEPIANVGMTSLSFAY